MNRSQEERKRRRKTHTSELARKTKTPSDYRACDVFLDFSTMTFWMSSMITPDFTDHTNAPRYTWTLQGEGQKKKRTQGTNRTRWKFHKLISYSRNLVSDECLIGHFSTRRNKKLDTNNHMVLHSKYSHYFSVNKNKNVQLESFPGKDDSHSKFQNLLE